MTKICYCCKKEKENGTYIDGRYVCDTCNHIKPKEEK